MKRATLRAQVLLPAFSIARSLREALARNVYVRRLVNRHPAAFAFVAGRFEWRNFSGLPLTALVAAFIYAVAVFAGLVEDVLTLDPIVNLDHGIAQAVAAWRTPEIVSIFFWITSLCTTPVVVTLIGVACAVAWLCNRPYAVAGLLVSSVGASALSKLSKLTFQRARPLEAVLFETSYSFPSGHTTGSVAFYGFVGYLLIRSASSWGARCGFLFAAVAVALLVGLSRIVLGVHFLSDVMGGYLVGSMGLMAGIGVTEWLTDSGRMDWHAPIERDRAVAATALLVAAAAGFAGFVLLQPPLV